MKYKVRLTYGASVIVDVDAGCKDEAISKAKNYAEELDSKEFKIFGCQESEIL